MQFSLTDLQKEIKENAEKLLSEKIDPLQTIQKVDKNVRIGDGVTITPDNKPDNLDDQLYCIRDGIVIIPKNTVIPSGTNI